MSIKGVPVRATINIANGSIIVKTPFILSFSVTKQRGVPATFNASVKVSHDDIRGAISGGPIYITAGTSHREKRIFTGMVRTAQISPCNDDPYFVNLSLRGDDVFNMLSGKKYTRRCRAIKGSFATIQSVSRKGLKSGRFAYYDEASGFDTNAGMAESSPGVNKTSSPGDSGATKPDQAGSNEGTDPAKLTIIVEEPTAGGGA